jgi:nicotinate phosphoribosyltransferase
MKLSQDKITLPGRKQVYRSKDKDGVYKKDTIALSEEECDGDPLLTKVMEKGHITYDLPSLKEIRCTTQNNLFKLPAQYKQLSNAPAYPVELSLRLQDLIKTLTSQLMQEEIIHKP